MPSAFLFTMSVLAAAASATATDFCSVITDGGATLPSICTCANAGGGFELQCDLSHTFGTSPADFAVTNNNKIEFEPCASGGAVASVSSGGDVAGTAYTLTKQQIGQGAASYIPIPGATLGILGGLYLQAELSGTLAALEIDLSLTACTGTASADTCLTPVDIIDMTFPTFVDACATPAPTPGPGGGGGGGGNSTTTSTKSNAGAIAGGVIGGLLGVGLIVGGVVFMRRRQAGGDQEGTVQEGAVQMGTNAK